MIETYNLPVKFTKEENDKYAIWGLKEKKILTVFAILYFVIILGIIFLKYTSIFSLYFTDYWVYIHEFNALKGVGIPFVSIIFDIIMFIISFIFLGILYLLCMIFIPNNVVQRKIEVKISKEENKIYLTLYEKKKILDCEIVDLSDYNKWINIDSNSVIINNQEYHIGENNRISIYGKNNFILTYPTPYSNMITNVNNLNKIFKGLLDSYEEKKKEIEWQKNNKAS